MSAPSSVSQRDLELVSSFLDGSLTPEEQRDFLARLPKEPALLRAVAEIRAVRNGLRELPPIRAARGFRLTKDMVSSRSADQPQRSRYYSWGSAAAALALALLLTFDLSSSWGLVAQSVPALLPAAAGRAAEQVATPLAQAKPNSLAPAAVAPAVSSPPAVQAFSSPLRSIQPTQAQALAVAAPTSSLILGETAPAPAARETPPAIPPPAEQAATGNVPLSPRSSAFPPWAPIVSASRPLLRAGELLLALAAGALAIAALISRKPRK